MPFPSTAPHSPGRHTDLDTVLVPEPTVYPGECPLLLEDALQSTVACHCFTSTPPNWKVLHACATLRPQGGALKGQVNTVATCSKGPNQWQCFPYGRVNQSVRCLINTSLRWEARRDETSGSEPLAHIHLFSPRSSQFSWKTEGPLTQIRDSLKPHKYFAVVPHVFMKLAFLPYTPAAKKHLFKNAL